MSSRSRYHQLAALAVVAAFLVSCANVANATVIAQHAGLADPTTEGWTAENISDITVGPGSDSHDYWDTKATAGHWGRYTMDPTSAQAAEGNTYGWTLNITVAPVGGNTAYPTQQVTYYNGNSTNNRWVFQIAAGAGSTSYVLLNETPVLSLPGDKGYHTWTETYNPTTQRVALSMDGGPTLADVAGQTHANAPFLYFGCVEGTAGEAQWSEVTFTTNHVPEPSAVMLLAMGVVGLLAYAWRRRR
jgi:hypothetical protein